MDTIRVKAELHVTYVMLCRIAAAVQREQASFLTLMGTQEKEQYRALCEQAEARKLALAALQSSMHLLRADVQTDFKAYLTSLSTAE